MQVVILEAIGLFMSADWTDETVQPAETLNLANAGFSGQNSSAIQRNLITD